MKVGLDSEWFAHWQAPLPASVARLVCIPVISVDKLAMIGDARIALDALLEKHGRSMYDTLVYMTSLEVWELLSVNSDFKPAKGDDVCIVLPFKDFDGFEATVMVNPKWVSSDLVRVV